MELVAASKMRKAQEQTLKLRDYAQTTDQFIKLLSSAVDPKVHPLLLPRPVTARLVLVITSDRGLAGVYNSQLLRSVLEFESQGKGIATNYLTMGKKGQDVLNRMGKTIVATFTKFPPHPTILDIQPIANIVSEGFIKNQFQSIHIAYTQFVSTIKQVPQVIQLLPMVQEAIPEAVAPYRLEPNRDEVLEFILPRAIETILYQSTLESIASEHSLRMIAMKNASDNAKELIDDLTLTYNSVRQANITQELAEITIATQAVS